MNNRTDRTAITTEAQLLETLEQCFSTQTTATEQWHVRTPNESICSSQNFPENLPELVLAQHLCNFLLWHVEDTARRKDVPDSVIVECKRRVDKLNQMRNDAMEEVDRRLCLLLAPLMPPSPSPRRNTETVGMAVDRLSILALKIYHMEEQTRRGDAEEEHIQNCSEKLRVLQEQRQTLVLAVLDLIRDYLRGYKSPALYAQMKMYNDPSLNPELYSPTK